MVQPPEWTERTYGRELDIDIAGRTIAMAYAGAADLTLPPSEIVSVDTLLVDPFVEPLLSRWGITLDDVPFAPELAYDHWYETRCSQSIEQEYTGCTVPGAGGVASGCYSAAGGEAVQKIVCNSRVRSLRTCGEPNGWTQCGQTGPQGCAVCWSEPDYSGSAICSDNSCIWSGGSGGGGGGGCLGAFQGCSSHEQCCSGFCNPESGVCSGEA
jgi:hypothetical protein